MRPKFATKGAVCALVCGAFALAACPGDGNSPEEDAGTAQDAATQPEDMGVEEDASVEEDAGGEEQGVRVVFEPSSEEFFATPFPSDAKLEADGSVKLSKWTAAYRNDLIELWFDAADELLDGWSLTSGVFVNFTGGIDESGLPDWASSTSTSPWPNVAVVDVDADSPERGKMFPITCNFNRVTGRLRVGNQLGCRSPYGVLKRANTTYAFVITNGLEDESGEAVVASEAMSSLLAGEDVTTAAGTTLSGADYAGAKDYLEGLGAPADSIVLLDLFTTGDPVAKLLEVAEFYDALETPTLADGEPIRIERVYEDYTVLSVYYEVPIVQEGPFPYSEPGEGKLSRDASGAIQQIDTQLIRAYVTIPRGQMPEGGWPLLSFFHGSGGVAEQLLDRGAYTADGPPPPGQGPAKVAAAYGIAGSSIDFQFHGMRFDPPDTSGLVLYNLLGNPRATIDNFLVAPNEVSHHGRLMAQLAIDPADVTVADGVDLNGASVEELLTVGQDGTIRFDDGQFTAMGQSMGTTIIVPTMTIDNVYDAGIFSGAGGSLIEIAVTGTSPIELRSALRIFLKYSSAEDLDQFDPLLHALQHVWDHVDPMVHAPHVQQRMHPGVERKHVLMHSGLTDGYFSPDSRTNLSVALGVPLVEPVYEASALETMALVGLGEPLAAPASANLEGKTAIVAQYPPSVLDGHNVAYQRDDTKAQYGCFLKTLATGTPVLAPVDEAGPQECGQ